MRGPPKRAPSAGPKTGDYTVGFIRTGKRINVSDTHRRAGDRATSPARVAESGESAGLKSR